MRFEGVYVANTTPFSESGEVAWNHLEDHLEFLAKSGVHGFVPCGTTGEGATLEPKEWRRVIEIAVQVAKKHSLKVIAGCGSNSTAKVVEMVGEAKALGANGALIVTPYYNKPSAAGLFAHYMHIANRIAFPIVLYNVPGRTNVFLQPETVAKLFSHECITGIKEASGSHSTWLALAEKCNLKKKALLAGDDDAFATILSLGGCGIISATANACPEVFVKIFEAMKAGDTKTAFEWQMKLLPLVRAMFCDTNPGPVKYALNYLRGHSNLLRLPLIPVTRAAEDEIRTALAGLGLKK